MEKKLRAVVVAGLVLGGAVVAGAAPATAAPGQGVCNRGDKQVAVTTTTAAHDANANGFVCEHIERFHAPKKPGPSSPSYTYYDDLV